MCLDSAGSEVDVCDAFCYNKIKLSMPTILRAIVDTF